MSSTSTSIRLRQRLTRRGAVRFSRVRLSPLVLLLAAVLLTALAGTFATAASAASNTAYVGNSFSESVTPIDLATNTPGAEIKVGKGPNGVAITPDSKTAYVANTESDSVTPIDVATNMPGAEIKVGSLPFAIAITPDGRSAYITNLEGESVTPIDVATNKAGAELKVGARPEGITITPDGKTAYVANNASGSVTPIDVATNTPGAEIKVGAFPGGIAITPDGRTTYVANESSNSVTPIDVATNKAGPEIKVGERPFGIAITPDGGTAYVTNGHSESVTPINVATNKAGPEIKVGKGPEGIAITPPSAPAVATEAASAITQNSATLNALVNPSGGFVGECRFEYGASASYGSAVACTPAPGFGPGPVPVSAQVAGLAANSEYHFRVSARNQGGASMGADRTFRTLSLPAASVSAAAQQPLAIAPQPPVISGASLTNRRFRVAKQATASSAANAPLGTRFHFTLSAAAKLEITITRSAGGLRRGHGCVAQSARLRRAHAKHCTRTLTLGTLTRASEPAGADSLAFSGRIGTRALSAGAYNVVLSASNAAGHSKPVELGFTIVRG